MAIKTLLILLLLLGLKNIVNAQINLTATPAFYAQVRQGTRTLSGVPGKKYWQNTADYNVKINFDPNSRHIEGSVNIFYINNSPDTLKSLVLKLYPNLYQVQSMRNVQIAPEDLTTGVQIQNIFLNDNSVARNQISIRGTNMFINNIKIKPGQKIKLNIIYNYTLNKGSFNRTGQVDSGAFVVAYSFPRIAVYDDIDGWNEYPYAGKEEFYNDFCNFHVSITLPGNYQVWATGELLNTDKVYNLKYVSRIAESIKNDSVTNIISPQDIKTGNITIGNQYNTWMFDAINVTDFAFMASDHYVWKATGITVDQLSKRRSRVDAVFNPDHLNYLPVIDYARKTVQLISSQIPAVPFPYSHETIFDGLDAMEYPMMVNNLPFEGDMAAELTAHEIFHTLFPFFVGTNETKYSFMDEGWATFTEFTFYPYLKPGKAFNYDVSDANNSAGSDQDVPIMTLTPQLYGKARFADKDLKPAIGFLYLKEMLGDKNLYSALRVFITEWQGKHPTPYDFFNCINSATGKNLNWFWKNWFFEKNIPDLAIGKVTSKGNHFAILINNLGTEFVPVHLIVKYNDGTQETLTRDVSVWSNGDKFINIDFKAKTIVKELTLGNNYDLDINKSNNTWIP